MDDLGQAGGGKSAERQGRLRPIYSLDQTLSQSRQRRRPGGLLRTRGGVGTGDYQEAVPRAYESDFARGGPASPRNSVGAIPRPGKAGRKKHASRFQAVPGRRGIESGSGSQRP